MSDRTELNGHLAERGLGRLPTLGDGLPEMFLVFTHPDEVMSNPELTKDEKRTILASWVSDARAVINQPTMRQLDNGAVVQVNDVLRALRSLDDADAVAHGRHRLVLRSPIARHKRALRSDWLNRGSRRGKFGDDDDDPPPRPASAAIPVRHPFVLEVPMRSRTFFTSLASA